MNKRLFKQTQFITNGLVLLMVFGVTGCSKDNSSKNDPSFIIEQNLTDSEFNNKKIVPAKPPYTIKQIEEHLYEMYKKLDHVIRVEVPTITWYIGTDRTINKLLRNRLSLLREDYDFFSHIIQRPIITRLRAKDANLVRNIVSIDFIDYYTKSKNVFWRNRSTQEIEKSIVKFKKQIGKTGGEVSVLRAFTNIKTGLYDKVFTLRQLNDKEKNNFRTINRQEIYEILSLSGYSNELISVKNTDGNQNIQPIDKAILRALYSNKIKPVMDKKKAIPIMSKKSYELLKQGIFK